MTVASPAPTRESGQTERGRPHGNRRNTAAQALLTGGRLPPQPCSPVCSSKTDTTSTRKTAAAPSTPAPSHAAAARPDSPAAFARLMEGNKRWADGRLQHPDRDPKRREFVAEEAAHEALRDGEKLPGNVQAISVAPRPAYRETARARHTDSVDAMVRIHTERTAAALGTDRDLAPLVKKDDLAVVSACYSLDTGRVEVLTGAPSA